jgi:hypothetical protein
MMSTPSVETVVLSQAANTLDTLKASRSSNGLWICKRARAVEILMMGRIR